MKEKKKERRGFFLSRRIGGNNDGRFPFSLPKIPEIIKVKIITVIPKSTKLDEKIKTIKVSPKSKSNQNIKIKKSFVKNILFNCSSFSEWFCFMG